MSFPVVTPKERTMLADVADSGDERADIAGRIFSRSSIGHDCLSTQRIEVRPPQGGIKGSCTA
jgi:hypothetical protein